MKFTWDKVASRLLRLVSGRPGLVLALSLALTLLALFYTREHLTFWTERNVLLSQKSRFAERYLTYRNEFTDDYLILVLSSKDLDRTQAFASRLGKRLQEDHTAVQDVFYRIPIEAFRRQALLYLDPQELDTLREKIADHEELLRQLAESPGLVPLLREINGQISRALVRTAVSGLFGEEEKTEKKGRVDPEDLKMLSSLMESLHGWLTGTSGYRSPWNVLWSQTGGLNDDGYLVDRERGWVFVLAYLKEIPTSFNPGGAAIARIRDHIRAVSQEIPEVTVGITGTPALNSEEMASSLQDMTRAMGLALALVTLLFVLGFGRLRRPLMAMVALAVGVVWTLGWVSLSLGHLTILSMAFGSILIGLGIDFGIHMIARYETERRGGSDKREALDRSLGRVGRAIVSSALTTAAAFFALSLSEFRGLREFGWVAGWGILFCLVTQLVLLPSFLMLLDRQKTGRQKAVEKAGDREPLLERIIGLPSRYPKWVVPAAGLLSLIAVLPWGRVRFDYNLLHLQAKGMEAVEWERKLLEAQGNSSMFAVDMVDSLQEAQERTHRYEALPLVDEVQSLATYLPANPEERLERVRRLQPLLEGLRVSKGEPSAPDVRRVERWLSKIRFKLREEEDEDSGETKRGEPAEPPPDTISGARYRTEQLLGVLEREDQERISSKLAGYQEKLVADFRRKIDLLKDSAMHPLPVTLDGLPRLLKKRFVGETGKLLLQVYPKEDVWQLKPQRQFVEQLRTVNPDVTGPAVVQYESTHSLLKAYVEGGLYAMGATLLILLVDFRRPLLVLLTLIPLLLAGLWTLVGMRLAGMVFNPANLVIIPLLVGIGVDNGIHVIRHFVGAPSPDEEVAGSSMGRAITLSSLTTIAGFGSLMVAHHQGIKSIGMLLTLAIGCSLVASLVVLPSILKILPSRVRRRLWAMGRSASRE